jgi:ribonucleoside-diphosphate reductase alpha chain
MGAAQGAVLRVAGDDWYLHTHTWTDGQPCEIFLTSNRQGSAVAGWSQVTAILASLALQYGCPVSELVEKLRYQRFDPADFRSTSPVDAVAQALARMFGELPGERATPTNTPIHTHWKQPAPRATTGDTCSACGSSDMRRSGACFVCGTCGTTSGCS